MSKRFLAILAVIIAVFACIYLFSSRGNKAAAPTSGSSSSSQPTNHVEGGGSSGVTLLEYGDYQCPACGAYYPIVKATVDKYKDAIYFQFRNFPLTQIHPNAFAGSRAAEAAGKQNKYWEMHDMLYEQQQSWSTASNPVTYFDTYAQQLGLDAAKFKKDYASSEVNSSINADMQAGKDIGANSTPTFVINGKKVEQNPKDQATFEKLITDAIAAQKKQ